ncbi:MAG: carboxypeptidase-like regulatory domain-containing protein, partial [Maioricimonas sp. JB049]
MPIPDAVVRAELDGQPVATGTSDAVGMYRLDGLATGVYRLTATGGERQVRVWTAALAPPASRS